MVMRTISATEARVHFGELMRSVVENDQPVIVERAGKPEVVVLAVDEYQRMLFDKPKQPHWQPLLNEAHEAIARDLGENELPDPVEIIRQMREERSEHFLDLLR